jgi:VanZ family protein
MGRQTLLSGVLLVLYCAFIFYLSSLSGGFISGLRFNDKLVHILLYLVLGLVFSHFLYNLKPQLSVIKSGLITGLFILLYGLSDEIHQMSVPGRNFSLLDLLADALGGTAGWLLFLFFIQLGRDLVKSR